MLDNHPLGSSARGVKPISLHHEARDQDQRGPKEAHEQAEQAETHQTGLWHVSGSCKLWMEPRVGGAGEGRVVLGMREIVRDIFNVTHCRAFLLVERARMISRHTALVSFGVNLAARAARLLITL